MLRQPVGKPKPLFRASKACPILNSKNKENGNAGEIIPSDSAKKQAGKEKKAREAIAGKLNQIKLSINMKKVAKESAARQIQRWWKRVTQDRGKSELISEVKQFTIFDRANQNAVTPAQEANCLRDNTKSVLNAEVKKDELNADIKDLIDILTEPKGEAVPGANGEAKREVVPEQKKAAMPEQKKAVIPEAKKAVIPEQKNAVILEQKKAVIPEAKKEAQKYTQSNFPEVFSYYSVKVVKPEKTSPLAFSIPCEVQLLPLCSSKSDLCEVSTQSEFPQQPQQEDTAQPKANICPQAIEIEELRKANAEAQSLMSQKQRELESNLSRQLQFIEELISDKKLLAETCEAQKKKLQEVEQSHKEKLQEIVEKHEIELKKTKDAWMQAENKRKEKWEKEKINEIKLMTTKALQPELESLVKSHKKELLDAQLNFEAKLREVKEKNRKEMEENMTAEKANMDTKSKRRLEKLEADKESELIKMKIEHEKEIKRLETLREEEKKAYEDNIVEAKKSSNLSAESLKVFYEERLADIENRNKANLKKMKEEMKAESEAWKKEFIGKEDVEKVRAIAEARTEWEKEKRKEIEALKGKFEDEGKIKDILGKIYLCSCQPKEDTGTRKGVKNERKR